MTVGIYDAGRGSVDLLDSGFTFLRRIAVEPPLVNPKGIIISDAHAVVLSGGRLTRDTLVLGVHWLAPGDSVTLSLPPSPIAGGTLRGRQVAAGGPLYSTRNQDAVLVADALSGAIWNVGPTDRQLVAPAPFDASAVIKKIDRRGARVSRGPGAADIWWEFPRVLLIAPSSESGYVELRSSPDENRVEFLLVSRNSVRVLARWKAAVSVALLSPDAATLYLIGRDSAGIQFVARTPVPPVVLAVVEPVAPRVQ